MNVRDPNPTAIEPVRVTARVRRSAQEAFKLFTENVNTWFPLERFNFGGTQTVDVRIEPLVGGRFYERYVDGREHTNGTVVVWDPPHFVVFTWGGEDWSAPTEVAVRFVSEGPQLTRVEVEHRDWDRLGIEGARLRDAYNNGWPTVIAAYAALAGAA